MKKRYFSIYTSFIFLLFFTFLACKKSDHSTYAESFTWVFADTNYTANFRSAFISSMSITGPLIVAGTGNSLINHGTGPSITIPSFNLGTYTFVSGTNTRIHYIDDAGFVLESISGTIAITENLNSRLSGNFSATLIDILGVIHTITGSFTNIPIEQ